MARWKKILCSVIVLVALGQLFLNTGLESHSVNQVELKQDYDAADQGEIWIRVLHYAEGIAGWQYTLAEVLVLAKQLNATLVEPRIRNGRLSLHGSLSLWDVLEKSAWKEYHPKIVSNQEFQRTVRAQRQFVLCMSLERHGGVCQHGNTTVLTEVGESYSRTIQQAQLAASQGHDVLLEIDRLWQKTLIQFAEPNSTRKLLRRRQVDKVRHEHVVFSSQLHQIARQALQQLNLSDYAVIHWRAEVPHMDYLHCAKRIQRAKSVMPELPFVLISSLMVDTDLEWGGAHRMGQDPTAHQALGQLLESGFVKLDVVLPRLDDLVLYSVVDWIVAQQAASFATCTGQCNDYCLDCNYGGKFAVFALELRRSQGRKSWRCWPKTNSSKDYGLW